VRHALGEENVFIIDTEYIEYEVGAEVEETINLIAALRLIKLTLG